LLSPFRAGQKATILIKTTMKKSHPYYDDSMWKGAPKNNFLLAKKLRENMTQAELVIWEKLKDKRFKGYKFRRQHPIQKYIVDFYCHKLGLIIEIDGGYHKAGLQKKADIERKRILEFQGLQEIRFTNEDVLRNINKVLKELEQKINSLPQP